MNRELLFCRRLILWQRIHRSESLESWPTPFFLIDGRFLPANKERKIQLDYCYLCIYSANSIKHERALKCIIIIFRWPLNLCSHHYYHLSCTTVATIFAHLYRPSPPPLLTTALRWVITLNNDSCATTTTSCWGFIVFLCTEELTTTGSRLTCIDH